MADFLRYYKKFLFHWGKELCSFGAEQAGGVILAMLILFFQIHMGIIPTKDIKTSALANVFGPYLALVGVYLIIHLVRTPWKLDQELSEQLKHQATQGEIEAQIATLTQLIERGLEFTRRCRSSTDLVPPDRVMAWAAEAAESVKKIFNDTYMSRFESHVGIPMGAAYWPNLENRHVDGFVWVRVCRLQEFVDELKDELKRQPVA
jgi:hypothetical protein